MLSQKVFAAAASSVLCLSAGAAAAAPADDLVCKDAAAQGKIVAAASFNAMAEFTRAVGGDHVCVETLIPGGTEPHDFTPTVRTVEALKKADLLILNGFGMEPWGEKTAAAAANDHLTIVTASAGASPVKLTDPEEVKEHGANDPHLWLSLSGASLEAKNIAAALAKRDPKHAQTYEQNAERFAADLDVLKKQFIKDTADAKRRAFVTGHAAFGYLARDFGLEQKSIEDLFAEGEPTMKTLAELAKYCRKNNVKTVFAEELVSPAASKTLAEEAGAKVVAIYTMESNESGLSYLERMKRNLTEIAKSLKE